MSLFPDAYLAMRARYRMFMEEHVVPNEARIGREDDAALALLDELRDRARAERPTRVTPKPCTCTARATRRSGSCTRSWPVRCGRPCR